MIDVDPVRPAGISSTDPELNAAIILSRNVARWLTTLGWPEPIVSVSGNGIHMAYSIDLPADDGRLIERILQALASRFDAGDAVIDIKTHRPAQLHKIPGTWVRKGDHVCDRPYRKARIIYTPDHNIFVSQSQLENVAAMAPVPKSGPAIGPGQTAFDLGNWIENHGLDVVGPREWQGGRRWVFRVCPWNACHTNQSAFIVQLTNGAIAAGCHHASCAEKGWHDLRDTVEPGWRERRGSGVGITLPETTHPAIRRAYITAANAGNGRRRS